MIMNDWKIEPLLEYGVMIYQFYQEFCGRNRNVAHSNVQEWTNKKARSKRS